MLAYSEKMEIADIMIAWTLIGHFEFTISSLSLIGHFEFTVCRWLLISNRVPSHVACR